MAGVRINPPVFLVSAGCLVALVLVGTLAPGWAQEWFPRALEAVSSHFSWLYVSSVGLFIAFCIWLLFSSYRHVRLGPPGSRPDYSTLTWFSMLFSAGMGIGLVFYGVAEPMMHYVTSPGLDGRTPQAAARALPLTYFHWGIHAWAIYAVVGLGIGYFHYRRQLPLALRSCFHPLIGHHIHGWAGHLIDILAVLGTLFGLATSLGLGAMQVTAGMGHLFGWPTGTTPQLVLIACITAVATISLLSGVNKGIRRLSELNMMLALCLLLFVFVAGPTLFIVGGLVENTGRYVQIIFERTLRLGLYDDGESAWTRGWTVFYWGWWISWAPFVGMFIARISRGRTIRQFVLGVLLVPTVVTFVWFAVFGGTALDLQLHQGVDIAGAVASRVDTAIYVMLDQLPLSEIASFLAVCVVIVFFVTSSDSASFVVDMLTSGGHPNPPRWQRVFWAVAEGAVAAALLYAAGKSGLKSLQAGVICIGLPFCIVILILCVSLVKSLREHETPAPGRDEP